MGNLDALDLGEREFGVVTEAGTVRFERLLPGPIERVWSYLAESEKRGKWLATGIMEQRAGSTLQLRFRHADLSPTVEETPERFRHMEGGATVTAQIKRCEPPKLLVMTWEHGPKQALASEVTFELTPRGDKVLLALTHRRLDRATMLMVASGWHTHLAILGDTLGGATPRPFWSTYNRIEKEYERRLAAG
jgi:uncharacterized protein YndB with AHSA1/START domain